MSRLINRRLTLMLLLLCCAIAPAAAQDTPRYGVQRIASDLSFPTSMTYVPDGSNRMFVTEKFGQVRILQDGQVSETPFLDIGDYVDAFGLEKGLLGIAFHPDYADNGWFFIYYSDKFSNAVIARYTVSADDPNLADPTSVKLILSVSHPYEAHWGGQLQFGPDGYLYISIGDDYDNSGRIDPGKHAQNPNSLLGKILRLDVNDQLPYAAPPDNPAATNSNFAPEVWARGLRNPWRFSFDRATGDMYIADVGQDRWEEINFQPAGTPGGQNYGWNEFEGRHTIFGTARTPDLTFPVIEYDHEGNCAVIGGYVYRGADLPDLQGTYLFSDFCSGTIWSTHATANAEWEHEVFLQLAPQVGSFAEDAAGEIYVTTYDGFIYKIVAT